MRSSRRTSSSTSAASTSPSTRCCSARWTTRGARNCSATSRSSCTAEPVRTSAVRRRRCSTRWRADAASRGRAAVGRELMAIHPGGSSVPVLTPDHLDTPLDYESIASAGSFFGSAAVIVIDDRCCMVQLALRAAKFYMHESCGKCTPCREGTRWMVQLLTKIEEGRAERADLDLLASVCDRVLGKSLCALGDFAVYPVSSHMRKFRPEFEAHVDEGSCPFGGESSVEGILAPIDQHSLHPTVEVPS